MTSTRGPQLRATSPPTWHPDHERARPAGPPPAAAALARVNGRVYLGAGEAVELDRKVHRDGHVIVAGGQTQVGFGLAGSTAVMRLDGHLMHARLRCASIPARRQ
jgi:hypothetical protein